MPTNQLFYGKVSSVSPKNENFIITTGDFTNGSFTFTIADSQLVRVGQTLTYIDNQFTGVVTITEVDGSTITVDQAANANAGSGQTIGLNTPSGEYFISSASFLDPQNNITVNDITGSSESSFTEGDTIYTIIGNAAKTNGTLILGRYYSYKIKDVVYRDVGSSKLSVFIQFNNSGSEAGTDNILYKGSNQTLPITSLTPTASLSTIFSTALTGLSDLPAGSGVAAYQSAVVELLDKINTGSVFPYTGSAEITGSLGVTGSVGIEAQGSGDIFAIRSSSIDNLKVNEEGVVQLFAHANDYAPTPVLGGLYFTSGSAYLGLES